MADMEKNPAENNGETPPEKPDGEPGQSPDGGTPPDKPGENAPAVSAEELEQLNRAIPQTP